MRLKIITAKSFILYVGGKLLTPGSQIITFFALRLVMCKSGIWQVKPSQASEEKNQAKKGRVFANDSPNTD